ncbi:sortase [Microbacteriaceae bacterium VKM Ac-2854]|nr:sortase [Microbacteriaceae bacterium VKM Ac-2854]
MATTPKTPSRRTVLTALGAGVALIGAGAIAYPFVWLEGIQNGLTRQSQQDAAAEQTWGSAPQMLVAAEPAAGTDFGTLYVPRFGADYARIIRQGVDLATVLDPGRIGHYPGTVMPGGIGNFSIAGHRNVSGAPMHDIDKLEAGDVIYVATDAGWFTYRHVSSQTLPPTAVDAIAPTPFHPEQAPTSRFATLQSCTGFESSARILALAEFDTWTPTDPRTPAAAAS